ncbi:phage tail tape measure protein [Shewanella ulleungensis]|uniref:phage tail tape measure protein n=1 Tax=Shewanella ulleungensis TaxID=2282699 RepID=UPI003D79F8DF
MSLPAPLMFTVGLIDQITKPIAKISQQFNGLASNYQTGTMKMASGAAGVASAAMGLHAALMPAIEVDRALGDIKGLGVTDDALKAVTETAFEFSMQYGVAATEVLSHTEKLRAAMGDMPAEVMQSATQSSATLAAVMKSDADTVTKYFKTLNGNYQGQADAMGQGKFIQKITGMTAMAKQKFGTSMEDMEGMMDGMHSLPSTLGVALEEQFAVLGMLGKQMGQGDAVTQYTNYLEGVAGAQEKLGVKLTDSKGNLLPMLEVLEKIKPMIAGMSGLDARTFLDDAGLGDGSLAIINMIENMDGLKTSIDGFKNVDGLGPATQMLEDMTDPIKRLMETMNVIRAALGAVLLPAFNDVAKGIANLGQDVIWFADTFPNLTKYIGYTAVGVMALVAAGGLFTITMGAGQMIMTTWGAAAMAWAGINAMLTSGLASLRGVMLAVNIAMYANPIGLIVAGIAAAVIAVGALIYYWDDLKAAMSDWGWLKAITGIFATVWAGVKAIFNDTMNWIIDKLNMIPGVDIDANISSAAIPSIAAIAPVQTRVDKGGITQSLSTANQQKSTNVGTVNVYPAKGENVNIPAYLEMHA